MDKAAANERILKLRKLIDRYRYEYHVLDKSEISDEALDSLKKELNLINKDEQDRKRVCWQIPDAALLAGITASAATGNYLLLGISAVGESVRLAGRIGFRKNIMPRNAERMDDYMHNYKVPKALLAFLQN